MKFKVGDTVAIVNMWIPEGEGDINNLLRYKQRVCVITSIENNTGTPFRISLSTCPRYLMFQEDELMLMKEGD